MEIDAEKFSSVLKNYVLERKKINPNISDSQIARNIGISHSTFYKMLNYNSYPSIHNFLKLCKSIPKLQTLITEEMLEVTRASKTGKYIGKNLESLLFQKKFFITYALALSAHGVTHEELSQLLGQESGEALRILTEKGYIIKTKGGRYKATQTDKGIILSFDLLKKHIKILSSNYKPDNTVHNYIYYKTESLNEKGLKKLHDIHRETREFRNLWKKRNIRERYRYFLLDFATCFL